MLDFLLVIAVILFLFGGAFAVGWQEAEKHFRKYGLPPKKKTFMEEYGPRPIKSHAPCICCREQGGCGRCE